MILPGMFDAYFFELEEIILCLRNLHRLSLMESAEAWWDLNPVNLQKNNSRLKSLETVQDRCKLKIKLSNELAHHAVTRSVPTKS